jgi:hypothetical protein
MKDLIAKTIVKNQYWVITDGDKKVGNVVADTTGYDVKLNGTNRHFTSTDDIRQETKIVFENTKSHSKPVIPFPEFPVTGRVHNSVVDIKRKLHLFTKTAKSKCYYAAGWFVTTHVGTDQVVLCPKYIFIQRYPYQGPFKTEQDAIAALNNT